MEIRIHLRRATFLAPTAALLALVPGPPQAATGQTVCTWGGTGSDQQGVFYFGDLDRYGARNTPPVEKPLAFSAAGPLAGADPRCTGTMVIHGEVQSGDTCTQLRDFGTVSGVPGVSHFEADYSDFGLGVVGAKLYAPDGELAGQYEANALTPPGEELHSELCRTQEGTRADTEFHATVELLP